MELQQNVSLSSESTSVAKDDSLIPNSANYSLVTLYSFTIDSNELYSHKTTHTDIISIRLDINCKSSVIYEIDGSKRLPTYFKLFQGGHVLCYNLLTTMTSGVLAGPSFDHVISRLIILHIRLFQTKPPHEIIRIKSNYNNHMHHLTALSTIGFNFLQLNNNNNHPCSTLNDAPISFAKQLEEYNLLYGGDEEVQKESFQSTIFFAADCFKTAQMHRLSHEIKDFAGQIISNINKDILSTFYHREVRSINVNKPVTGDCEKGGVEALNAFNNVCKLKFFLDNEQDDVSLITILKVYIQSLLHGIDSHLFPCNSPGSDRWCFIYIKSINDNLRRSKQSSINNLCKEEFKRIDIQYQGGNLSDDDFILAAGIIVDKYCFQYSMIFRQKDVTMKIKKGKDDEESTVITVENPV